MLVTLPLIVAGALFTLSIAYAFGVLCFRTTPLTFVVRVGLGAAIESLVVFLLLLTGFANWIVFLAGGLAALAALYWIRPVKWNGDPASAPLDRPTFLILSAIFAAYGALYLINALAPEIQPDAMAYHLGLVSEYVRLGRFPSRIGFFEMVPQGLEMLFTVAFAFGRHSAAKLVHFAFLLATVPLLLHIGRRLGLSDRVSLAAAALYFCAPVVGVSGTSAYNDAGLVFFVLATLFLLLDHRWAAAGIAAGFCYAIKFSGLLIAPVAIVAALLIARRIRPALAVAVAAVVMIAPWMIRDTVLTGNPVAPLFNRVFPNPWFRPTTDDRLAESMRAYPGFSWAKAPLEYALSGNLQGTVGPAFLLLPIGLLALRNRTGRIVWLAASVALIPWLWNVGTRFLMPALPFFAMALAMVIPKPLTWACLAFQAVACWPAVMAHYAAQYAWRLEGAPLRAALRLEPETVYLSGNGAYNAARMVETNTNSGERIFSLTGLATAYLTRETTEYWHSAQASELMDALILAVQGPRVPMNSLRFEWPATVLSGLRFRAAEPGRQEWRLFDVRLFSNADRVFSSPQWTLKAWPNVWEAPLALDDNPATCWRTWRSVEGGMYLELDFDHAQLLTRADLACGNTDPVIEAYGRAADGRWHALSDAHMESMPPRDLRRDAVRALKRAGFQYVVAPSNGKDAGEIGKNMLDHAPEWGVKDVARSGDMHLFRLDI